ncbi:hypothetical protein KFK14_03640 [Sphingobium phenoxybenzoativorans]|uniref:Uncharacterized protein n=1 Tax=Sphingobium phenoxybenzoativorans TaxID=1592790 RepID=A0A975Q2D3_9SPHN|nr:hypothetical protein [Sphingobium phenoxybenzoativorans]QUT06566.1 hypothetical protein KFK14_03640 [Sphingobium phenoxybenzoativorans]
MMTWLVLAVAPAAVLPPPPPAPVRVPPPIFQESRDELLSRKATIEVDIRAGGQELWSGPMRLAGRVPATFSRQKSDAPADDCAAEENRYSGVRSSLSVNLSLMSYGAGKSGFRLTVNWDRPADVNGCGGRDASRSVGLTQTFNLEPGQETSLTGDGGLTIRLRRRD